MSHGKPLCETVVESRGWPSGTFARIVAGEFTNYERTTIKARFELRWWSFQLLDGHESSASDPCIRRGNVRLLSMPVAPIAPQSRTRRRWTV